MRKIALALAGLLLAFLAARAVHRGMAGDETLIRWLVQDGVAAFNGRSVSGCMAGFGLDWVDTTVHLDRASLQYALLRAFQSRRELAIEVPDDRVRVSVRDSEPRVGEAVFPLTMSEAGERVWEISVHAELVDGEEGWQIVSSRHETVAGARPRR